MISATLRAPAAATLPWQLGAAELAQAFAQGSLSPVDALESTLERMRVVQPQINALVACDLEGARAAAQASALRWRRGAPLSVLDGVPLTVKDNIPVAGLPCRWGSKLYADFRPGQDEAPVQRLRAAGLVILGKTNVPEFTLQGYTDNLLDGVTRNPWDLALTPGGSSGGAVAAVASGIAPLALATDGGGSIRRPAGYAGLAGLKPSWGAVPRSGGLPEILPGLEVIGPIARSVADLVAMMRIIAGPATGSWQAPAATPGRQKIVYWRGINGGPVDPDILASVDAAAVALQALGHRVEEQPAPACIANFNDAVWPVLSATGLAAVLQDKAGREAELTPAMQKLLEQGRALRATDLFEAQRLAGLMRAEMSQLLTDIDFILTPTAAALPWSATGSHPTQINGQAVGPRGHAVFTAFANAAGLPGLALPAAPSAQGLPIGLQLIARQGADAALLALGLHYEHHHPWRQRWPTLD
jgi:aspartyl-tRNA(Asn)/glutamyl-tRNA(Gln) amidotransferase subunit A